MAVLEIEGRKVEVDDSFKSLSPEEQARTVEEIAAQIGVKPQSGPEVMGQVNRGIAEGLGGLVDFVNPLDDLGVTGSAVDGLKSGMGAIGAAVAESEPEGVVENLAYGVGNTAALAGPAGKTAQALSRAPGAVGRLADDAYRSMATRTGAGVEVGAGASAQAAEGAVRDAGGPEWAADTAAILTPMGAAGALSAGGAVARNTPVGRGVQAAKRNVAPFTKAGGREVARQRMQSLAGGPERAERLAERIAMPSELRMTPAQKTGDPNMLGMERLAAEQDPNLRERLQMGEDAARTDAQAALTPEGDVDDTRDFFRQRQRDFAQRLQGIADQATARADERIRSIGPNLREGENSEIVTQEIGRALEAATAQERELWDAVPRAATVEVMDARRVADKLVRDTPRAQRGDVPQVVRELLLSEDGFGNQETVAEMHGLYSELRRVARSAMAGNDQNKNRARIANSVADAILEDLGALDGRDAIGRAVNEARAYSAALHETFDRGAPGKILQRTLDGDTQLEPRLALSRTVGRGRESGAVANDQIAGASGFDGRDNRVAGAAVEDYLKERFSLAVGNASGEFTPKAAATFMRDNRVLLDQFPALRDEVRGAVGSRDAAERLQGRVTDIIAGSQNARQSQIAGFLNGPPEEAINGVFRSQNPVQAARLLTSAARKDETGQALAGVKVSLASRLMRQATTEGQLSPDKLNASLADPANLRVMRSILSQGEMARFQRIGRELAQVTKRASNAADVGTSLSGATANKYVEYLARVVAARQGAQLGGATMAGGLQGAQMASSRAKDIMNRIASDQASKILAAAVEDPKLFQALLTDPASQKFEQEMVPRILPYLIGGTSAAADVGEDRESQR